MKGVFLLFVYSSDVKENEIQFWIIIHRFVGGGKIAVWRSTKYWRCTGVLISS